jgi:hypothetical protein
MSSQLIPSFHRTGQSCGFAGAVISNVGREKKMRSDMSKWVTALLLECVVFAFPHVAGAQGSAFAKLDFGGTTSIEVPRNWTYQDENLRRHLNTASEAATRLAGITPNPGENVILVAANAYTSFQTASATLRLSVRGGQTATQAEVSELSKVSKSELLQLLEPFISESRKAMAGMGLIRSAKTVDARISSNQALSCMFFESELDTADGTKLLQTYICPMGDRLMKLSTSYRKSEATLFRPVLQYVWSSLKAK